MTLNVNSLPLERLLEAAFSSAKLSEYVGFFISSFVVFSGVQPEVVTSSGSAVAVSAITVVPEGSWTPVANNTIVLLAPLAFTPTSTATATFIRFFNDNAEAVFDISVSETPGSSIAVLEAVSCVSGAENYINDLRFSFGNTASFRVSPSIAEFFLQHFGNPTEKIVYDNSKLASASILDPYTTNFDKTVTISAYEGIFPDVGVVVTESNLEYNLLWETTLTENDFFDVSGHIIALSSPIPATTLGTGTPEFVQIHKAGFAGGSDPFPECVIHIAIGDSVTFSPANLVEGETATLTSATVAFGPAPV